MTLGNIGEASSTCTRFELGQSDLFGGLKRQTVLKPNENIETLFCQYGELEKLTEFTLKQGKCSGNQETLEDTVTNSQCDISAKFQDYFT